jgi:hypothetical protein
VGHIEHYANDGEFVARWGLLSFDHIQNRFMGRVFVRSAKGHLFNQHYLNAFFPLDSQMRVSEDNSFMNSYVEIPSDGAADKKREGRATSANGDDYAVVGHKHRTAELVSSKEKLKAMEVSRLWKHRNGLSPDE